ncbi:helix-turn-helix domain-containing protein [Parvibaculum sp.]|uniref:helix-turn-helix domain-containing protein n=1 Tax=Parvibaculum sp. TaxID=2024848 RepID=UPI003BA86347
MKSDYPTVQWKAQREFIPATEGRFFSFKADTDLWTRWHYHPEIDVLLVLKNTGYHLTGDFMGDFGPGTLLVNGSNVPHAFHPYEAPEGDSSRPAMFVIQFSAETLGPEFMAKLEMERIRDFIASTHRSLEIRGRTRNVVESLIRQMVKLSDAQRLAQFILILDAMANAPEEDRVPLVSQIYAPSLKQENVGRIDRVKNWIVDHLEDSFQLEDVAAHVGMSPKSFSRFFKKNTGKAFIQYVNELRIGLACRLLVQSEAGVSEICYATGFRNLSNFNRQFRGAKRAFAS